MTWTVEPPRRVGAYTLTAISEASVTVHAGRRGLRGAGRKRPALVLLQKGPEVRGMTHDGHHLDAAAIEARYPGAIARMQAMLGADEA